MKYRNVNDAMVEDIVCDVIDDEVVTDTVGYIPSSEEPLRLLKSGEMLQAIRAGYQIEDIKLAMENDIPLSYKRYADRLEAEQMLADIRNGMKVIKPNDSSTNNGIAVDNQTTAGDAAAAPAV